MADGSSLQRLSSRLLHALDPGRMADMPSERRGSVRVLDVPAGDGVLSLPLDADCSAKGTCRSRTGRWCVTSCRRPCC